MPIRSPQTSLKSNLVRHIFHGISDLTYITMRINLFLAFFDSRVREALESEKLKVNRTIIGKRLILSRTSSAVFRGQWPESYCPV
jgi:hypothetical protein